MCSISKFHFILFLYLIKICVGNCHSIVYNSGPESNGNNATEVKINDTPIKINVTHIKINATRIKAILASSCL